MTNPSLLLASQRLVCGGKECSLCLGSDQLSVLLPPFSLSFSLSCPPSLAPLLPLYSCFIPGLELCDPTQRLRVALAGELVGVGGHFLFLGLALVSKDWRFLQRMITAPCILFLFYGLVLLCTCDPAFPMPTSSLALSLQTDPPALRVPLVPTCPVSPGCVSSVMKGEASLSTSPLCLQLARSLS